MSSLQPGQVSLGILLVAASAAVSGRGGEEPEDRSLKDYGKDCLRAGCHGRMKEAPWTHGPVAVGACDSCHEPKSAESGHRFQLTRPREKLCTFCHKPSPPQPVTHKPYADADCTACHDSHGGKTKSLLAADGVAALCEKCHDRELELPSGRKIANTKSELASAKHKHGPVEKGDCGACHVSHSGPHPQLLRGGYTNDFYADYTADAYELCFSCHDRRLVTEEQSTRTGFRDGERNLHHVHVHRKKGRTCSVCHEPHASRLPAQVRDSVPFGPGGWRLPIEFKKTGAGGSCSSGCHKKQSYDNSRPPPAGGPKPAAAEEGKG